MTGNEIEIRVSAKDDSKRGLDSAAKGVKSVGDAAKDTGSKLRGAEDGLDRFAGRVRGVADAADRGRSSASRYGDGLDGIGNRADELDTRMMGTSDAITGVSDLMAGPGQVGAAGMAMGMADLGSAMYNTVIPSLKDAKDGLSGLVQGFKEGTGRGGAFRRNLAGIAAGAATLTIGIGMVVNHLQEQAEAEQEAKDRAREWAEQLRALDGDQQQLVENLIATDDGLSLTREAMDAAGVSTSDMARQIANGTFDIEKFAEAAGLSKSETFQLYIEMGKLTSGAKGAAEELEVQTSAAEGTAEANRRAAEEIRGVSDALAAQVDPAFAVIDAQQRLADAHSDVAEAEQAVTDAAREFGEGSAEHVQAVRDLERAQIDEAHAGWNQQQSLRDLAAALEESGMSVDTIVGRLQTMANEGTVTQASVGAVAASLRDVPGQVHSVLTADASQANAVVEGVAGRLRNVRLLAQGIVITARSQGAEHQGLRGAQRHGGIIGGIGAARSGGIRGSLTMVGEGGPELVRLPYGSTVIPAGTTREMARANGAGPAPVVLDVRGSSRELVALIQSWVKSTHGGNVQRALGWGST